MKSNLSKTVRENVNNVYRKSNPSTYLFKNKNIEKTFYSNREFLFKSKIFSI